MLSLLVRIGFHLPRRPTCLRVYDSLWLGIVEKQTAEVFLSFPWRRKKVTDDWQWGKVAVRETVETPRVVKALFQLGVSVETGTANADIISNDS